MIRKLSWQADGVALVLDEQMLKQLGIDENTSLDVTIAGRVLTVNPAADSGDSERFRAALEETNRVFGDALRRLAE